MPPTRERRVLCSAGQSESIRSSLYEIQSVYYLVHTYLVIFLHIHGCCPPIRIRLNQTKAYLRTVSIETPDHECSYPSRRISRHNLRPFLFSDPRPSYSVQERATTRQTRQEEEEEKERGKNRRNYAGRLFLHGASPVPPDIDPQPFTHIRLIISILTVVGILTRALTDVTILQLVTLPLRITQPPSQPSA